jgi:hypothetical protein
VADQSASQRTASRPFVVDAGAPPVESWGVTGPGAVSWRTLVSGDRTPSTGLTVGYAEVEPGDPERLHVHRHEQDEVYYVIAGEGAVTVGDQEWSVAAGSTVFIPGGEWHSARNTGTEVLRLLYVFAADSFAEIRYEYLDGEPGS